MGYSCTAAADRTFAKVLAALSPSDGPSNVYTDGPNTYHVEYPSASDERADGGIEVEVYRHDWDGARVAGKCRIAPDGKVLEWAGVPQYYLDQFPC